MSKYTLLIVEDNAKLNQSIRALLQPFFAVTKAATIQQATALIEDNPPFDLLLLDRTLPDGDGLQLISTLETISPQTKICILSQRDKLAEKLYGFEQGADVYLCKPIHFQELRAQVIALTRRGRVYKNQLLERGSFVLDTASHSLTHLNHRLQLTLRESTIMAAFLDHPRGFLSKSQLFDLFWQLGHEPNSSVIHVTIQRLRRKLDPLQVTIQSLYGAGYQLQLQD